MHDLILRDRERFFGSIVGMGFFGVMFLIILTASMPIRESMKHHEWVFYSLCANFLLLTLPILGFAVSIIAWKRIRLTGEWIFYNIGFYGFVLFGIQLISIIMMTRFFSSGVSVFEGAIYRVTVLAGLIISCIIWLVEFLRPKKEAC